MHAFAWWPTLTVLIIATITDLRSRRIPNWLVGPFLLAGVIAQSSLHGWAGARQSLYGVALGALAFGVFACAGSLGMGDVKLCAAIGAWIGPEQLALALLLTSLAGGAMAIGWAVTCGFTTGVFRGTRLLLAGLTRTRLRAQAWTHTMPYAPAIAVGTLISFFAR
jgi:prepilin peptidase CpaA